MIITIIINIINYQIIKIFVSYQLFVSQTKYVFLYLSVLKQVIKKSVNVKAQVPIVTIT